MGLSRYSERGMKVQWNKLVPHNGVVTSQEDKNIGSNACE
jgi:hypothetical protein